MSVVFYACAVKLVEEADSRWVVVGKENMNTGSSIASVSFRISFVHRGPKVPGSFGLIQLPTRASLAGSVKVNLEPSMGWGLMFPEV